MWSLHRTLSLRYLRQRWLRAALIIVSIALGVAVLLATRVLNQSMAKAARGAITPLAGAISDHTWTRLGRRRPFMLVGTLVNLVFLALMSRFVMSDMRPKIESVCRAVR